VISEDFILISLVTLVVAVICSADGFSIKWKTFLYFSRLSLCLLHGPGDLAGLL
jgi:hypothetical protein